MENPVSVGTGRARYLVVQNIFQACCAWSMGKNSRILG